MSSVLFIINDYMRCFDLIELSCGCMFPALNLFLENTKPCQRVDYLMEDLSIFNLTRSVLTYAGFFDAGCDHKFIEKQ